MQSLLKGETLQLFNKKVKSLKNQTNAQHAVCISVVSGHIFPKNALQKQCTICKRSVYTIWWPLASMLHIGIRKQLFCPISPTRWNGIKDWWWWNHWTDPQKSIKFIWKAILSMQRNAKNGRPRRLPIAIKFNNMVAKNVKKSVKEIFETLL